jgi:hypothetical protein
MASGSALYQAADTTAILNLAFRADKLGHWYRPEMATLTAKFGLRPRPDPLGFYRTMVLTRGRPDLLEQVLGPSLGRFDGEYRYSLWRIEKDGVGLWVLSSAKQGTTLEVEVGERDAFGEDWPDAVVDTVVEMVDDLFRRLHAAEPGWMPEEWEPPEEAVVLADDSPDTPAPGM